MEAATAGQMLVAARPVQRIRLVFPKTMRRPMMSPLVPLMPVADVGTASNLPAIPPPVGSLAEAGQSPP